MTNSTCSQSVDDPTLAQPLDGRFHILRILTTQFCRRVYLAQDLQHPKRAECLVYHLQGISQSTQYEEAIRALLLREVNLLAELGNHPQIPALIACFEDEAGFYVVQEKISGTSLSQVLQWEHCWRAEWVIQFLLDALELLAVVHEQGGVHGNLTPNAILQGKDGQLRLIDFGSLLQIQESLIAASGQSVPYSDAAQQGYQPLEQLQGISCPASDVYAVGMMGIQALTGLRPIQLKVDLEAKQLLWHSQYQAESDLERKLVDILDRMVEWDLTQRYGSAVEALNALEPLQSWLTDQAPVLMIAADVTAESTLLAPDRPSFSSPAELHPVASSWDDRPDYQFSAHHADYPVADLDSSRSPAIPQRPDYHFNPASAEPEIIPAEPEPEPDFPPRQKTRVGLSQPTVLIGAGGTVATLGLAAVGWSLLASVGVTDKVNGIWDNFSKAQSNSDAETNQQPLNGPEQWQKNWQAGADTYQQAEEAFNLGKWLEVSKLSQRMPPIPYWQDRGKTLSKLAIARVETDANQLLQSAYTYASDRNFTAALRELNQIPQETSINGVVQTKIKEYSEKQVIRAWFDLQRAYDRAAVQDFGKALTYLWQIPVGTPPYEVAQEKIAEYTQKQAQYIQSLIQAATDQAQQGDFQAALLTLDKAPKGTAFDPQISALVTQFTQRLNQQTDQQLEQATLQAQIGDTAATVAALEKIPMGTVAYAQARDKIAEYTGKIPGPVAETASQQAMALPETNSGS